MLTCFRPAAILGLLLLLLGCAPEGPPQAVAPGTTHDLGAVTIRLPNTWQPRDYAQSGLEAVDKGPHYHRYLFVNAASRDTAFRDIIILLVDQRGAHEAGGRTVAAAWVAQELVKNLYDYPGHVQVLAQRDTLLRDGQVALVEARSRNLDVGVDLLQVYGAFVKDKTHVVFMGVARSQPGAVDQRNRCRFRRAVESVAWK
jgi:hypothetical protein